MAKVKRSLKLKKPVEYCWLIAYINSEYVERVHSDLARHKILMDVEAYIPTVKVLTKKKRNTEYYDTVPLLFNYGFFKIPKHKAIEPAFLDFIKDRVSCLIAWVKDPAIAMEGTQIRVDTKKSKLKINNIAVATDEEIANLILIQDSLTIHSSEDLSTLSPGAIVTLKNYPFDGMDAEVVEIHKTHAIVNLLSGQLMKKVKVDLGDIFYTVYKNQPGDSKVTSIEELGKKGLQQIYNISINLSNEND